MPSSLAGFLGAGCSPPLPPRNTQDRAATSRREAAGEQEEDWVPDGRDEEETRQASIPGLGLPKVSQEGKLSLQVGGCRAGILCLDLSMSKPL